MILMNALSALLDWDISQPCYRHLYTLNQSFERSLRLRSPLLCGSLNSSSPKDIRQAVLTPFLQSTSRGSLLSLLRHPYSNPQQRSYASVPPDSASVSHTCSKSYSAHTQFLLTQLRSLWPFVKAPLLYLFLFLPTA